LRQAGPADRAARAEDAFRGFVAVLLPDALREAAAQVAAPLRGLGDVKWVAAENYHLTLKFLGQVPVAVAPGLGRSLQHAAAHLEPFRLELAGLGAFPTLGRPQTIWIGAGDGREALERLASAVEAACSEQGFKREERPFHAHLTLGRVNSPVGRDVLAARLRSGAVGSLGAFAVESVHLMRSRLLPRGPIYSVEETFSLGAGSY
jgi:RNA 2',3'-cyclic 3'-phosphodiesterase